MPNPDFALQWLNYLGIKIYNKDKQILEYNGRAPRYEISQLGTSIKEGQELGDEADESKFTRMNFYEFDREGYAIKGDSSKTWKPRQRIGYVIIRKTENTIGISYNAFRKAGIYIEHDASRRRFRIKGENVYADKRLGECAGVGPWIVYDEDAPAPIRRRKKIKLSAVDLRGVLRGQSKFTKGSSKEAIPIKDVPFMISDEKYVVCLKKTNVPPRILVTGQPRKGKSLLTNALSGRMFYLWGDRVGWIIDPQNQFYNISLPSDVNEFIKRIGWLNEKKKPIPALQFYLACKNKKEISNPNISLKLTLNFHEFLNKFSFYSHGTPFWKLDKAERYLRNAIRYIKDARDITELEEGLYNAFPQANDEKKGEGMRSMVFKWINTFQTILHENFTSNLYSEDDMATDELKVLFPDGRELKGHPFIMAMEAGAIPVINTSMAPKVMWVRNYLADLMQKIVSHQKVMKEKGERQRFVVVVDEMQEIYEEGTGRKDNCSTNSEMLFRQGGFQGVGYIGNTQSLEKLNKEMIKHATHIVCFYTQCPKERKMIKDMFQLQKEDVDQLLELKEQEFMIFSKEPFIIYDRWGRRKEDDRCWFKGKIIPPFNYHIPPE